MQKTVLFSLALFLTSLSFGQIGIRTSYLVGDDPVWDLIGLSGVPNELIGPETGFSVGLDYWFRLKNQRIEFYPEINYATLSDDLAGDVDLQFNMFSFYFNTQIYFLDFAGDCDCPTFSKDGTIFDKGLFLLISPGYSFQNFEISPNEGEVQKLDNSTFNIGAGLGLDIGISDVITLTPFGGARYYLSTPWNGHDTVYFVDNSLGRIAPGQDKLLQFFAGIRLGFRFDDH